MQTAEPLLVNHDIAFEDYAPAYRSLVLGIPHTADRTIFLSSGSTLPLCLAKDPYFQWLHENFCKIADPLGRPWLITNGDYFSHISWKPNESQLSVIKNQGLNIFHYEPVFIYNSNGHWPWIPDQSQPRYLEIEFVASFAKEHHLKDVTIHVCEQGLSRILEKIPEFSHLRFRDWSTYLIEISGYEQSIAIIEHTLERRFICTNFRYDPFREMLAGFWSAGAMSPTPISLSTIFITKLNLRRDCHFDPRPSRNGPILRRASHKCKRICLFCWMLSTARP